MSIPGVPVRRHLRHKKPEEEAEQPAPQVVIVPAVTPPPEPPPPPPRSRINRVLMLEELRSLRRPRPRATPTAQDRLAAKAEEIANTLEAIQKEEESRP